METPSNSLQETQSLSKGRRSRSANAGMLDVPPLCYKNPNRARRSRSSTSPYFSSIQSTSSPSNGTPTQSRSNPSAGGIDNATTDAEEKTTTFGARNLKIKITKISPRGSLYELNPATLRLNIPSPVCWNRVEHIPSKLTHRNKEEEEEEERLARVQDRERTTEMHVKQLASRLETGERRARPRGRVNDQFALGDGIKNPSHKISCPTSRSVVALPVARPLKKPASTRGSRRDLAAELRNLTEGAFEWLAEQVLLEGFDVDGNSFDEDQSIPSSRAGSCDVWDFSPPTPSNLPLPLVPVPFIVEGRSYVRETLLRSRTEREIWHPDSPEHGFEPQVSRGDTSHVEATSSAYLDMKPCDSVCEGGNSSTIAVDTRPRLRTHALLIPEQDSRKPFTKSGNSLHLELPGSLLADDGLPRYRPSSSGSSQTPSPLSPEPCMQSNVATISNTTLPIPTSIYCQFKRLHSEQAVKAQTPLATASGRPRANTVDSLVPKTRSIFATSRMMVTKVMSEAVQIVTPCPSLATLSSLSRPRALSSPQAINIATQAFSTTENTESTFTSVGNSDWDSTTVIWALQTVRSGSSHSDGRITHSTTIREPSTSFPFASVGPSSPRSGRVPVSPELYKLTKNFSRPTRLL